jgi:hypothetical protein
MSDELDRVTHALRHHAADVSRSSDYIAELLSTALCAAANRALTVSPNLSSELVLQGIVFTMDRELESSSGIIRAQALDLYLEPRGEAAVGVFLDLWGSKDIA